MLISPEQEALIGQVFATYLTEHHREDILQLIADTSEEIHRSVFVNAMTLFEASMEVADYFNAYPGDVLTLFDKVLQRMVLELAKNESSKRTKEHIMRHIPHTRITGLPVCPEMTRDTIPRSRDVGHFLSVTGTVIRTSVAKVLEYERDYMCTKCRHVFTKQADFDQFYVFAQLTHCPNPDGCNSIKFSSLSGGSEPAACKDYQEIKIQEQVQRLSVGCIPRSVLVVLEDDLVDSCKSGDDVTVYGVMCQRWKPFYDGNPCTVELVLRANNIEVNNQQAAASLAMKDVQKEFEDFWNSYKQDPIAGRNHILLNLCPQVFGMYLVKLAVALVLAGGVQRIDSSGTKIRGECHLLLVGDPGTGKSQFLKYAAKIMPRSVLTAGIGSTSAGLTVAAVKDGVDWHLEAGALVLADGGLCCIDEFNSIKEHDRISIHEAMEQQSISVAKAGMVCKLNTRTSILAATNPKGQYDPNEPLSVNVALASPLLSRFDLVLVLMDNRNPEWDRVISAFILEGRGLCADSTTLWTMEKIKAYFSVIKSLQPQMSAEANSILTRYYQLQRRSDGRNTARTTIRMLESLSRLAEAHSRLMYRETVTIEDAVMAVSVMECSMQGGALLGNVNALFTTFPADPREQYKTQCQLLLEGLNLSVLLQKELDRLARLKSETSDVSSPPAQNRKHPQRDTTPITNCRGDGLDWFHSITSSLSPDGVASPVITSTQQPINRKLNSVWSEMSAANKVPNCQSVKDILSSADSAGNSDIVADPFGTIISPSADLPNEKNDNMGEENLETEEAMKQRERWNDRNLPESLHVFQKVSRNTRDKRLKELKHQQCAEEHLGRPKESRLVKKVKRGPTESKNICDAPQEKLTAEEETRKELHNKLSGFIFKPRKMRPTVCHEDTNTQTESPRCTRLDTENRPNKKTSTGVDESDTEGGRSHSQLVLSSGIRRNQASSFSQVGARTSVEPDTTIIAFGNGVKIRDKIESQSHDKVNNFTGVQKIPEACKRGPEKPTVSSSTLSKLSRFSFACTNGPTTTTQTNVETNPLKGVNAENLRGDAGDMQVEPTGSAHQGTCSKNRNDGATDLHNTINVNKRKCFELGPVCSRGSLSGLFSSAEVGNDVLDTDWDQEVSKKFKI